MAATRVVWTDVDADLYVETARLGPAEVGGPATGYEVTKRRLRGGLSDGVDVVRVNNGVLAFDILPTRGMGLWKAWMGGVEYGWRSPVHGPVHPAFVPLMEPGGLGWLDGFDELLVRCGLESNGAPEFEPETGRLKHPLHGRIANKPARSVTVSVDGETGEIAVTGVVEETRFHFLKLRLTSTVSTRVGEPILRIHDVVENLSESPAETQLLYHVNFGEPLLDAGARFVAPVKTVVPRNAHSAAGLDAWDRYASPKAGYAEEVFFVELLADAHGQVRSLLRNAVGDRGVSLTHDARQLPCYTLWKNTTASRDGSVTGLEPGTNFPNPRSFEGRQGRVVKLAGGASTAYDVSMEFHGSAAAVRVVEEAIAATQGRMRPELMTAPHPVWCA
jgi:hypothetical protein